MARPVSSTVVRPITDLKVKSSAKRKLAFGRAVDQGAEQARRGQFATASELAAVLSKRRR